MKGRTPTKAEKQLHDRIAQLGCIACLLDGRQNYHVSIHHIDGRTKPEAHLKVIGLCGPHHQHDDTDPALRIGVHPYKARFEQRYGTQEHLLSMTMAMISEEAK